MSNHAIQTEIPVGSRVRIGVPAEMPSDAIAILQAHLRKREAVESAHLGLMEVQPPSGNSYFTYTIGLRCNPSQQAEEVDAALKVLVQAEMGRWPISVFPLSDAYFTQEALRFYERSEAPKKMGLLARFLGRW